MTIRDAPLTAKLTASPDVAEVISTILLVVTVIGVITFFIGPGKTEVGPCTDQPPDDHGQCVRFRKVSDADPGPAVPGGG
jgi:hypothetical protein